MKVIVHVNQHVIKHNAKHGTKLPTLTVKLPGGTTRYAHEVAGESARVIDSNSIGRSPLSCGARVWIEYEAKGFHFVGDPVDFTTISAAMKASA